MRHTFVVLQLLALLLVASPLVVASSTLEADFEWLPEHPTTADVVQFRSTAVSDRPIVNCDWNAMVDGRLRWLRSQCEPTHRFERPGVYNLRFIVTNDLGETNETVKRITIGNQSPMANASYAPLAPTTDDVVTFTDGSSDLDGAIATYRWTAEGRVGVDATFTHRFSRAGAHEVKLEVQDDSGGKDSWTLLLHVGAGVQPAAEFLMEPRSPEAGQSVQFTDLSRVAQGDHVASWTWAFADGVTLHDQHVLRSFAEPGSYQVVLTVTTDSGQQMKKTQTLVVVPAATIDIQQDELGPGELAAPLLLLISVSVLLLALAGRNRP